MEFNYQFEEWRDIPEYFGLYQISNFGRVKSLGNGNSNNSKERILKLEKTKNGYLQVWLSKDGKRKRFKIHRLVAEAFIQNQDNLPQVNHKNEDKTDNRACNLEWCDAKYNLEYNDGQKRRGKKLINGKKSKQVNQYTKDGLLIASYQSTHEVQRQTGYSQGNISACCRGKKYYKTAYGYIWKYV